MPFQQALIRKAAAICKGKTPLEENLFMKPLITKSQRTQKWLLLAVWGLLIVISTIIFTAPISQGEIRRASKDQAKLLDIVLASKTLHERVASCPSFSKSSNSLPKVEAYLAPKEEYDIQFNFSGRIRSLSIGVKGQGIGVDNQAPFSLVGANLGKSLRKGYRLALYTTLIG